MSARASRTLEVAAEVTAVLEDLQIRSAVIGAIALAAHGYPRSTEDVDLATNTDLFGPLTRAVAELRARGFDASLGEPDADDPPGGVVTVTGPDFDNIQIVNFRNPFAPKKNPGQAAIDNAVSPNSTSTLRIVTLADLVALKLYAGGPKSMSDISELLTRNQPLDLVAIRAACAASNLDTALEALLESLGLE